MEVFGHKKWQPGHSHFPRENGKNGVWCFVLAMCGAWLWLWQCPEVFTGFGWMGKTYALHSYLFPHHFFCSCRCPCCVPFSFSSFYLQRHIIAKNLKSSKKKVFSTKNFYSISPSETAGHLVKLVKVQLRRIFCTYGIPNKKMISWPHTHLYMWPPRNVLAHRYEAMHKWPLVLCHVMS